MRKYIKLFFNMLSYTKMATLTLLSDWYFYKKASEDPFVTGQAFNYYLGKNRREVTFRIKVRFLKFIFKHYIPIEFKLKVSKEKMEKFYQNIRKERIW